MTYVLARADPAATAAGLNRRADDLRRAVPQGPIGEDRRGAELDGELSCFENKIERSVPSTPKGYQ